MLDLDATSGFGNRYVTTTSTTTTTAKTTLQLFVATESLSLFGNSAISIVLPWLVLSRTGDPSVAGLVAAIAAVPSILATLVRPHPAGRPSAVLLCGGQISRIPAPPTVEVEVSTAPDVATPASALLDRRGGTHCSESSREASSPPFCRSDPVGA